MLTPRLQCLLLMRKPDIKPIVSGVNAHKKKYRVLRK